MHIERRKLFCISIVFMSPFLFARSVHTFNAITNTLLFFHVLIAATATTFASAIAVLFVSNEREREKKKLNLFHSTSILYSVAFSLQHSFSIQMHSIESKYILIEALDQNL